MIKQIKNSKIRFSGRNKDKGFSLLEVMIAVAIISILSAIAWPIYQNYVTKSKRVAASVCVMEAAQYMERFYTMNMRYDETKAGAGVSLPDTNCMSNVADDYSFDLSAVSIDSFTISAEPIGTQASRDVACGTMSLDDTGLKKISGTSSLSKCW